MVLNAAVQMLREADELKEKILKFKSGTSMLQEQSVWTTQQQLQKIYQKVLVLDLDYALEKKVEQDLWNVGFKQQIEALQAISKDRKNPLRSEAQAMLSWVLQAAAGFYLCLLHQICTTFKLDLPFRRRASLLGLVEGWGAGHGCTPPAAAARYVTQHCLVHLGDLARYRHQLRVAHTFYRHAVCVSVHCGQPYNQLALVAWRRGRRLAALYWHVRSLLVRAPFPPAPANLRRTLAMHSQTSDALPVLDGAPQPAAPGALPTRLDSHSFVTELIRAANFIHSVEELDTAEKLVHILNSSFIALVATDCFEPMTLIKMSCVIIWLIHSTTDNLMLEPAAMTEEERRAGALAEQLAAGCLLALLLPVVTTGSAARAAPAVKVWLCWLVSAGGAGGRVVRSQPALCAALAAALSAAPAPAPPRHAPYETVPLPEDEELHGFLPLEASFKHLKFASHASWDTYGGELPEIDDAEDPVADISTTSLSNEPELEKKIRMHRILQLGKQIADLHPDRLSYTEEDGILKFTAAPLGEEQLSHSLAELQLSAKLAAPPAEPDLDEERETDDELGPPPPRPPLVISEADFREKVIEKRVGILKPQGSLERAREERAMANSQDDQELEVSENEGKEDKKEAKKMRVNIAMAAIMRKQEETNKQVKFVTPPLTPEVPDISPVKDTDKTKIIQPKVIKSLANLPVGRKTGGILSLKDKSAGYPHLVNIQPEPKKAEKEEKKDPKPNPGPIQTSQTNYQRQEASPNKSWNPNIAPPNMFNEGPRMNFHKVHPTHNLGANYAPSFQPAVTSQGIRLPVVNPKEIDVRTAALQKQNSRQELFPEGHKYQLSNDKQNFLNDLPPRFANQYRHWQQDSFSDNKFKDDNLKNSSMFNQQPQRSNWLTTPSQDSYQQSPMSWWKPENQTFNNNFSTPLNMQSNLYSPVMNSNLNPYPNMTYNQMQNQHLGPSKPENVITPPNYMQAGAVQALQGLAPGGFGFPTYDTSMYPQFTPTLYPPRPLDKPTYPPGKDPIDMNLVGFRNPTLDSQQRSYGDTLSDLGTSKSLEHSSSGDAGAGGSYSLFSGAAGPPAWTPRPHQSLWSGPGPSPLERLLEQQKQMKQPPAPQ